MRFKAFDNIFKDREKDVDPDFTVCNGGGCAGLLKEWEKFVPLSERNLYACDRGNDACRRMSDKVAEQNDTFTGVLSQ